MSGDTTDSIVITDTTTFTIFDNDGHQLTQNELNIMDRGVREARERGYCDEFDRIASIAFNVRSHQVVDADGWSCSGYDMHGFNSHGYDRDGFDREGYNSSGFNISGRNKEGYDRYGFNAEGFDKEGNDRYRYDADGYDREGYYRRYDERRQASRQWYELQASKPQSAFCYDRHMNPRPSDEIADTDADADTEDQDY